MLNSKTNEPKILVVGDLMIDQYLWGSSDRVSPEAPVPVVLIHSETSTLGGAGNVVKNLISLGANVDIIGVIGDDLVSSETVELLAQINVSSKIPPILVSIGMLGTFVGILISLASFSEGFKGNAPGISMNSAMSDFIGGMFVAFASSVFGLAFSLLYRVIIDFITEPHRLSEQGEKEADVTDLLVKMTEVKDAISNGDDDSSLLSQMRFLRTDMSDKFSALQNSFESFQKQMSENNIKLYKDYLNRVSKISTT